MYCIKVVALHYDANIYHSDVAKQKKINRFRIPTRHNNILILYKTRVHGERGKRLAETSSSVIIFCNVLLFIPGSLTIKNYREKKKRHHN